MGTHIGWTSQFFKIFTQNRHFTLTELIIVSSMLPLGALIGQIIAAALQVCLKFKCIFVLSGIVSTMASASLYVTSVPYAIVAIEYMNLPLSYNFYHHLIGVRCVFGIIIGILHQVIPIYCHHIVPTTKTKSIEYFFNFQLAFGIFVQYAIGKFKTIFHKHLY